MTASEQPLVAVLTPVYNGGKYLAETMACVQAQTYPNLVHVVLDNASTDTTPEIISRYLNSRVPVVTKRNSALLPQRENYNATVALAPAEARYLKILAADDLMRPDAIARLVDVCERNPNVTTASCLDCYNGTVRSIDLHPTRETHPGREFAERAAFLRENFPISPYFLAQIGRPAWRHLHFAVPCRCRCVPAPLPGRGRWVCLRTARLHTRARRHCECPRRALEIAFLE